MNVLMQGRFGLFDALGGDRVQIENTAEELRKLGVKIDTSFTLDTGLDKYDLIHVFQLDWTAETHLMVKRAHEAGKPVVLSPIHHKVSEVKRFDEEYVFDFRRISKVLFKDQHNRDVFKNVYRSLMNPKMLKPTLYSIVHGLKNMHKNTIRMSDMVLVQTELEAKDLRDEYNEDFVWEKVSNGVSARFLNLEKLPNPFDFGNYIFCVGRIEPRKNQLKVIEAVKMLRKELDQDLRLVLVGGQNPKNHFEYTRHFRKALNDNSWITYVGYVPYEKIPAYFQHAKVCVNASWFETTGLTLLEALYCTTNAVASSPRAEEILGDYASYCDPGDVSSIKAAIKKEIFAERPEMSDDMKKEYTWENTAKKTLKVYKEVLKK